MINNSDITQLNRFQKVRLELLWGMCRLIAILPYWFQYYVLQEFIYCVIRGLRYRYRTITDNLRNSFPEKSDKEIGKIRNAFYLHLAEMMVNTIVQARMSDEECRRRLIFEDGNEIPFDFTDRTCVGLTSHLGCWEYYGFWGMWLPNHILVAVYHKLHNPVMDALYKRLRDHSRELPVPAHESLRFFMRYRNGYEGRNLLLGLISDQNPPRYTDSHWFRFLNRDTLFFEGGEQLALKYKLPMFYFTQYKIRRGYYKAVFKLIYDGTEEVETHVLTERYVRMLEKDIQERPEMWMWSHRRWKHRRDRKGKPVTRSTNY
ncbi:MAG: lysophospholipid acyltransferase family protein [Alistipes sp.]|nr:lysophospholipid acyltransferase family protein [Alistipes sp.]